MFLFSLILIFISSWLIMSLIPKTKNNLGFIYLLLIAFGQIVLSFEILSLFKLITRNNFLAVNLTVFLISLILFFVKKSKLYFPQIFVETKNILKALKKDKFLIFLSICFVVFMISELLVVFFFPVTFGDALAYYFTRCLSWIQNGSIAHFITPDTREVVMPVNMDLLYTWLLMFRKSNFGTAVFSYISMILAQYVIYNLLGECGYSRRKRLWSVFVFSSFAIIGIMSYTPCADLFIGSLILCAIYLFFVYVKRKDKYALYFSTLSYALAAGTKTTAVIAAPSLCLALFLILVFYKKTDIKKDTFKYCGLLLINFIIFSSYNYILNIIQFSNPISCTEQLLLNKFRGGIGGYLFNLVKYTFVIFDCSGLKGFDLYNSFITNFQTKVLALMNSNPSDVRYISGFFDPVYKYDSSFTTATAALGIMGLLAFLPSIFIGIFKGIKAKFSKKTAILFILAVVFIFNILLFSRVMVFTKFNIRYLVTFAVMSSPIVVLTYIKQTNIIKWILCFFMFIYLAGIAHTKPVSIMMEYKKFKTQFPETKLRVYNFGIVLEEEDLIYKYLKNKPKGKFAILSYKTHGNPYGMELLKLHGFLVDKLLLENIEVYNLSQYDYIIYLAGINNASIVLKFKEYLNNDSYISDCTYVDNNNKVIEQSESFKKPAAVNCTIPIDYVKKQGFEFVNDLELEKYVLMKNTLE
ncbi:MAG: glycosyltransferase family 39 protein [Candidatus Gastranaerophilales bacterium]|nr:glycosyltransferase family 39 protein [Candidatus Gastranaerophilales bacterium]